MQLNQTAPARFWAKVSRTDGCWVWTGARRSDGYGQIGTNGAGTNKGAHRVSYTMAYGPIPDGQLVCHSCDNRLCVRPDHLWLGTHSDNIRDAYTKGRRPVYYVDGQSSRAKRVTVAQAMAMRAGAGPADDRRLAEAFGVKQHYAYQIRTGQRWGHLSGVDQ